MSATFRTASLEAGALVSWDSGYRGRREAGIVVEATPEHLTVEITDNAGTYRFRSTPEYFPRLRVDLRAEEMGR